MRSGPGRTPACALALACLLVLGGCAAAQVKPLRFAEHPYCSVLADGVLYRFHHDRKAPASLAAAATRWPQRHVQLASREAVEFDCLRSVQHTLESAGKTVGYAMDD